MDFWGSYARAIESAGITCFIAHASYYQDALVLLRAQVAQSAIFLLVSLYAYAAAYLLDRRAPPPQGNPACS